MARMFARGLDARLTGMDISVHTQPNAHPVETGWVDDALAGARTAGVPLGALVGRPLAAATANGWCAQVSGSARLDLRDVGIRVPGFLVRRFVDVSVSAQATRQA